jgi:hypothetical protein
MPHDFLPIPLVDMDCEIRFWTKAIRKGPDDCWIWVAGCTGNFEAKRRPVFKIGNTNYIAARVAWMIKHKKDPGNLLVCHTCTPEQGKRQLCVNPNHLWLGTYSQNSQDAADKGLLATDNRSKLTDSDITRIIEMYESGMSAAEIGKWWNLTRESIWRIATGRRKKGSI